MASRRPRCVVCRPGLRRLLLAALWAAVPFVSISQAGTASLPEVQPFGGRAPAPAGSARPPAAPAPAPVAEPADVPDGPPLHKGDRIEILDTGGGRVYHDVVIRSLNARTVSFAHAEGLVSLPLRGLPSGLRARLGYSPAAEAAAEKAQASERSKGEARRRADQQRQRQARDLALAKRYEQLMQKDFLVPAVPRAEVDLRQRFFALDLGVKNQGMRPSCAVFAVVGALEFLNAEVAGKPEHLSEEYLVWGTRKLLRRDQPVPEVQLPAPDGATEGEKSKERIRDSGFSLDEVVMALRAFGIPLQASMPNTFGTKMSEIQDPPPAVVDEARARRKVFIHPFPGRSNDWVLSNIIHTLNAGIPVPIGLRWPHPYTLRRAYLSEQKPVEGYAHAVTLVGYRCASGNIADTTFIFRNSYGTDWGQGGYGIVTIQYLARHMLAAALIEVQDRDEPAQPGS